MTKATIALAKAYWVEEEYHTRMWTGPSYYPDEDDHLDRVKIAEKWDKMPDEAPYAKALVKELMKRAVIAISDDFQLVAR